MEIVTITEWLLVLIGALNTIMVFLLWRIRARTIWLMGATASHSFLDLQIKSRALQEEGVEVLWWDPSRYRKSHGRNWPRKGKHGEKLNLSTIYLAIPEEDRVHQPSWLWRFIRGY